MQQFDVTVLDERGEVLVTVSADSESEARSAAAQHGLVVRTSRRMLGDLGTHLTSREREVFLSKLATLLASRVGMGASLRLLGEQFTGRPREVAQLALQQVEAGADLCSALEAIGTQDFPAAQVALIRAGLRAGPTHVALEKACEFEAEMREVQQARRQGLGSAVAGYFATVLTVLAAVLWIGPTLATSPLIKLAKTDIGWAINAGYALGSVVLIMTLLAAGLLVNSLVLKRVSPVFSDTVTAKIPVWREVALGKEQFLGLQSLASLLAAGLSLEKVFRIAEDSVPAGRLRAQFRAAAGAVEHGDNWAECIEDIDKVERTALASAMDRGQSEQVLRRLAREHKAEYIRSTQVLVLALQVFSAVTLTLSGALLFAVSVLPMLQVSARLG